MGLPVVVGWSGGKDSTLALAALLADERYDVVGLITTVTAAYDRISIHGVRRELLRQQVEALSLDLVVAPLSPGANNAEYETSFLTAVTVWKRRVPALAHLAFGDLFLTDIRTYRERLAVQAGCQALFPVWGQPTDRLARRFIAEGYRARVVCVDEAKLDSRFAGRAFDFGFLDELPKGVDPCGENGEFHTFVHSGPIFHRAVDIRPGEVVRRDGCTYADLLPGER